MRLKSQMIRDHWESPIITHVNIPYYHWREHPSLSLIWVSPIIAHLKIPYYCSSDHPPFITHVSIPYHRSSQYLLSLLIRIQRLKVTSPQIQDGDQKWRHHKSKVATGNDVTNPRWRPAASLHQMLYLYYWKMYFFYRSEFYTYDHKNHHSELQNCPLIICI